MYKRRRRSNPWRIVVLVVLVLGALYVNQVVVPATPPLFMPTPTPTRAPASFVTDAQQLEQQGKFTQAIQAYEDAIQADPKNAGIYISLSRLQIYTGLYEDAVSSAEKALLLNQNNATAQSLRGWALGYLGDYINAEAALNSAIEVEPNNPVPYAYLAEVIVMKIQADQGDLTSMDTAIEYSHKAEELGPNTMEVHRARGLILEMNGTPENLEVAAREYEAAITLNPNIADLHLALGRVYRSVSAYPQAVEEFQRAITLNPTDADAYSYTATTHALAGDYTRAIQFAEEAVKREPDNPYWHGNLGQLIYRQKEYAKALPFLRLAVRGGEYELEDGETAEVEGLPVTADRAAGYYSSFGLALAYTGACGEALDMSQYLATNFATDETIAYNAQEMVNICQRLSDTGTTEEPTETPADTN